MWDSPERDLDPPEHWTCDECGIHFHLGRNEELVDDQPVLCCDCTTFDGQEQEYTVTEFVVTTTHSSLLLYLEKGK